jgi:hypothetical protein
MNEKSIAYSACHEAGHAFVRAKNGDRILLIDAIERFVSFRTPDWKCACGGYLHQEDSGSVVYASFWRFAARIWKRVSVRAGACRRNNVRRRR